MMITLLTFSLCTSIPFSLTTLNLTWVLKFQSNTTYILIRLSLFSVFSQSGQTVVCQQTLHVDQNKCAFRVDRQMYIVDQNESIQCVLSEWTDRCTCMYLYVNQNECVFRVYRQLHVNQNEFIQCVLSEWMDSYMLIRMSLFSVCFQSGRTTSIKQRRGRSRSRSDCCPSPTTPPWLAALPHRS